MASPFSHARFPPHSRDQGETRGRRKSDPLFLPRPICCAGWAKAFRDGKAMQRRAVTGDMGWDAVTRQIGAFLGGVTKSVSFEGVLLPGCGTCNCCRRSGRRRFAPVWPCPGWHRPESTQPSRMAKNCSRSCRLATRSLREIHRSWSWRVTAPLRGLGGRLLAAEEQGRRRRAAHAPVTHSNRQSAGAERSHPTEIHFKDAPAANRLERALREGQGHSRIVALQMSHHSLGT